MPTPPVARTASRSGIAELLAVLDAQVVQAPPRRISRAGRAAWDEQTAWLISVRDRYAAHTPTMAGAAGASEPRFAALQASVEREVAQRDSRATSASTNQADTVVSGVMKTRHDTARNAISNVR
jgi:hypothetical protein